MATRARARRETPGLVAALADTHQPRELSVKPDGGKAYRGTVKAVLTLMVAVLASIGIGVGVSASSCKVTGTSKVSEYGQPGCKFLADFPG